MNRADLLLEQAAAWFARLDRGALSPAESQEFDVWRAEPAHAQALARIQRTWGDFAALAAPPKPVRAPRPWRQWAVAAGLALALGTALDLPMRLQADLRADGTGSVRHVLADGSTVLLDSGAAIVLDMDGPQRTIHLLRGEALFSVAHDPSRPFVVETGHGTARALGTRFTVRRDPGRATITVLESRVQVSDDDHPGTTAILTPGQSVSTTAAGLGPVRQVDAESESAWARGKLIFTEQPLEQVVEQLNRYFPGRIVVRGDALRQRTVSGVFSTTDPLAALDGLEKSLGLRSTRLGSWLVFLHG